MPSYFDALRYYAFMNKMIATFLILATVFTAANTASAAEPEPGCSKFIAAYWYEAQAWFCPESAMALTAATTLAVGIATTPLIGWAVGIPTGLSLCVIKALRVKKFERAFDIFADAHDCTDKGLCDGEALGRLNHSLQGTAAEDQIENTAKILSSWDRVGEPCGPKDGKEIFMRSRHQIRKQLIKSYRSEKI